MKRVLAAAILVFAIGCARSEPEPAPRPFPFDLTLGKNIAEIRAHVSRQFGSDEGLDSQQDAYRSVLYVMQAPEAASGINVVYDYRPADGVVWAIGIAYMERQFEGDLAGVSLRDDLDAIRDKLGKPLARRPRAPVIDSYWWETPTIGYRVNAYSEEYGSNKVGDVDSIEVWRRDLAPPGYDAERTAPDL